MAEGDGSSGITRENFEALGFEVASDGTLYVPEEVPAEDAPELLEFSVVDRPAGHVISCTCCLAEDGDPCICDGEDCPVCSDVDEPCSCCRARAGRI